MKGSKDILDEIAARVLAALSSPERSAACLVTSIQPQEGKTFLAAHLATFAARTGRKTVMVVVGSPGQASPEGLSAGSIDDADEPITVSFKNREPTVLSLSNDLTVLPRMSRSPRDWFPGAEIILMDAPHLDSALTRYCISSVEGTVLVADTNRSGLRSVMRGRQRIVECDGKLLGVVLNRHKSPVPYWLERRLVDA